MPSELIRIVARPRSVETHAASALADGMAVAWFQDGSEFGPRSLGQRSLLADPRDPAMLDRMNVHIKRREPFRPFAPVVLAERRDDYFIGPRFTDFMLTMSQVVPTKRHEIPAVVHVDDTSRLQTVAAGAGKLRSVIEHFDALTGVPVVLNTSFNCAGEPMVETPQDALDAFVRMSLDRLYLGPYVVEHAPATARLLRLSHRKLLSLSDYNVLAEKEDKVQLALLSALQHAGSLHDVVVSSGCYGPGMGLAYVKALAELEAFVLDGTLALVPE